MVVGVGLGISLVLGGIFLTFVAEVYYVLWWKRRRVASSSIADVPEEEDYAKYAKGLLQLICWKKPSSCEHPTNTKNPDENPANGKDLGANGHELTDLEVGSSKDSQSRIDGDIESQESVESELMRLHNLHGPPRFLFTIEEETREDLESEDARSRGDKSRKGSRTRSLSDIILALDQAPFLTPLASPTLKSSSSLNPLESYGKNGFNNPLFESMAEADLAWPASSPPPKFKFLRDAEEKLLRRLREEAARRAAGGQECGVIKPCGGGEGINKEGPLVRIIVGNNGEKREVIQNVVPHFPTSTSQVLPLASSPTAFRPEDKNSIVH
ncbi:hypothetical protein BT93_J1381 [Corymbia citriodora subsp. variegata]|nr:hypothetical protein BT93_J1381 [Corymbia citriodora subsp. variegata]